MLFHMHETSTSTLCGCYPQRKDIWMAGVFYINRQVGMTEHRTPGALLCHLTTNQSEESLHIVKDEADSDPLPKWLTVTNFPFLSLKIFMIIRIFRAGSWTWVHLLLRLLNSWIKQTFLLQPTLVSRVLAFKWQGAEPEFDNNLKASWVN